MSLEILFFFSGASFYTQWKVEETIRFIQRSHGLEDIRVLTYNRIKNLVALVLACLYFSAGWLGTKLKLMVLACHVHNPAKRLFGIKEILWRVGKGPLRSLAGPVLPRLLSCRCSTLGKKGRKSARPKS